MLKRALKQTSDHITDRLSHEIRELGQHTADHEQRTEGLDVQIHNHPDELEVLRAENLTLQSRFEDFENRDRRSNLRICRILDAITEVQSQRCSRIWCPPSRSSTWKRIESIGLLPHAILMDPRMTSLQNAMIIFFLRAVARTRSFSGPFIPTLPRHITNHRSQEMGHETSSTDSTTTSHHLSVGFSILSPIFLSTSKLLLQVPQQPSSHSSVSTTTTTWILTRQLPSSIRLLLTTEISICL